MIWAKSSSKTRKRGNPKFRAPKRSSAEHIDKFEAWRGALEAGSIVNDLRDQFHQHREMIIREKLKEMEDVTPQERDRIARITEELIERLLEEPQQKLQHGRGMRGRLAGLEAIRHLFGLDAGKK